MNKGMYERFVNREFPEPFQSRIEGFASQCGCGEEYNFRAGFFCALHLEELRCEMHYPARGDLPEPSGEMHAQRKPVLAYTKSLGWTQAIRRRVGKKNFEWVCSNYDGNTLFFDDEITAWTELPEPEQEEKGEVSDEDYTEL